jgi:hypothetical protein
VKSHKEKGRLTGIYLEQFALVACRQTTHYAHDDHSCRRNTEADESQFPLDDECDYEGREKSGETLESETQLLANASLNHAPVRRSLCCDGSSRAEVEKCHFLSQSGLKVVVTNVADYAVTRVGEEGVINVGEHKSSNSQIDEEETTSRVSNICIVQRQVAIRLTLV